MIQLEELRTNLTNIKPELMELRGALDLETGAQEVEQLEKQTAQPGFWDQPENSQKVLQRIKQLKDKAQQYAKLEGLYNDTLELIDLALEEGDESLYAEVQKDYDTFQQEMESQKLATLLKGEYDEQQRHPDLPRRGRRHRGPGLGRACSTACTPAGRNGTASSYKMLDYLGRGRGGHQERVTFSSRGRTPTAI